MPKNTKNMWPDKPMTAPSIDAYMLMCMTRLRMYGSYSQYFNIVQFGRCEGIFILLELEKMTEKVILALVLYSNKELYF